MEKERETPRVETEDQKIPEEEKGKMSTPVLAATYSVGESVA